MGKIKIIQRQVSVAILSYYHNYAYELICSKIGQLWSLIKNNIVPEKLKCIEKIKRKEQKEKDLHDGS